MPGHLAPFDPAERVPLREVWDPARRATRSCRALPRVSRQWNMGTIRAIAVYHTSGSSTCSACQRFFSPQRGRWMIAPGDRSSPHGERREPGVTDGTGHGAPEGVDGNASASASPSTPSGAPPGNSASIPRLGRLTAAIGGGYCPAPASRAGSCGRLAKRVRGLRPPGRGRNPPSLLPPGRRRYESGLILKQTLNKPKAPHLKFKTSASCGIWHPCPP